MCVCVCTSVSFTINTSANLSVDTGCIYLDLGYIYSVIKVDLVCLEYGECSSSDHEGYKYQTDRQTDRHRQAGMLTQL